MGLFSKGPDHDKARRLQDELIRQEAAAHNKNIADRLAQEKAAYSSVSDAARADVRRGVEENEKRIEGVRSDMAVKKGLADLHRSLRSPLTLALGKKSNELPNIGEALQAQDAEIQEKLAAILTDPSHIDPTETWALNKVGNDEALQMMIKAGFKKFRDSMKATRL